MDKRYNLSKKYQKNSNLKEYFEEYVSLVCNNLNNFKSFDDAIGLQTDEYLKGYDFESLDALRTPVGYKIIEFQNYRQTSTEYRNLRAPPVTVTLLNFTKPKKNSKYIHDNWIESPKRDINVISVNLLEKNIYLLTVRFLKPFIYVKGKKNRSNVNQFFFEISLLSCNTLKDLKNHIMCTNNLGLCKDVTDTLDRNSIPKAEDLCPSSFLYIDSVFYTDFSNSKSIDSSKNIREWATKNGYGPFSTSKMDILMDEIKPRFGYPYVYSHLGYCEHLFYFADARLLQETESKSLLDYPRYTSLANKKMKICNTCGKKPSIWFVHSYGILPNDFSYLCDFCVKSYCYINEKPIENVKIYPYYDDSALV